MEQQRSVGWNRVRNRSMILLIDLNIDSFADWLDNGFGRTVTRHSFVSKQSHLRYWPSSTTSWLTFSTYFSSLWRSFLLLFTFEFTLPRSNFYCLSFLFDYLICRSSYLSEEKLTETLSSLNVVNIFRNLEWRGESSFFRRFFTCFIVAITYVAPKPAAIKTHTKDKFTTCFIKFKILRSF